MAYITLRTIPADRMIYVTIKQAGGKYGMCTCPLCNYRALYKFSAGAGHCEGCESTFSNIGGIDVCLDTNKGKFCPHWIALQAQYNKR